MPAKIAPMTDTERWVVQQAVNERYGKDVELQDVETEIRLHVDDRELTLCPGFYWTERGCHFVLSKTGDTRYRSMFFYRIRDRFATGREEYDDIGDCVTTLLKMQADEEGKRLAEGEVSGNS
jgi:hypothetical protein